MGESKLYINYYKKEVYIYVCVIEYWQYSQSYKAETFLNDDSQQWRLFKWCNPMRSLIMQFRD